MSKTPETDKAIHKHWNGGLWSNGFRDYARELEMQRDELMNALQELMDEYEDRKCQFGDEYLWDKHEDATVIENANRLIAKVKQESK